VAAFGIVETHYVHTASLVLWHHQGRLRLTTSHCPARATGSKARAKRCSPTVMTV